MMEQMGGAGGAPGEFGGDFTGGDEADADSDDEDLPGLESTKSSDDNNDSNTTTTNA